MWGTRKPGDSLVVRVLGPRTGSGEDFLWFWRGNNGSWSAQGGDWQADPADVSGVDRMSCKIEDKALKEGPGRGRCACVRKGGLCGQGLGPVGPWGPLTGVDSVSASA